MAVIVLPAGAAFIAGVVGVGYTFTASRQRVVDKLESKFGEAARCARAVSGTWQRRGALFATGSFHTSEANHEALDACRVEGFRL